MSQGLRTFSSLQGCKLHDCLSIKLGQSIPPFLGFFITVRLRSLTASGPHVAVQALHLPHADTLQSRAERVDTQISYICICEENTEKNTIYVIDF